MKKHLTTDDRLTKEQAEQMVQEIIGASLKQLQEKLDNDRKSAMAEIAYAMKHQEAKQTAFSRLPREEKLASFAKLLGCISKAGPTNIEGAAKIAKDLGDSFVAKALGTSSVSGGGVLVQPEFASELIELLRADAVVLKSGARPVPMASGILNFGRVGGGVVAAYRGESANAAVSEPSLEEIELRARLLAVMTPASNQLLERTANAAAFIQEELIMGAADKMDATFIRSDGSQNKPRGMKSWCKAANKFNETNAIGTTGKSTLAEIVFDLGKMMRLLMDGNVNSVRPGWLFAPRTWQRLFTILDSNGNPVFQAGLELGKVYGIPYKTTTNIPTNLTAVAGSGSGSDASEIYLSDFFRLLVGETQSLRVSTSTEASYNDGTDKHAFQRGETLIKVEMEHDFAARHGGAEIAMLESVTWGTV